MAEGSSVMWPSFYGVLSLALRQAQSLALLSLSGLCVYNLSSLASRADSYADTGAGQRVSAWYRVHSCVSQHPSYIFFWDSLHLLT